jgi:alpha-beta hydrolase superfamily lysophospholipase
MWYAVVVTILGPGAAVCAQVAGAPQFQYAFDSVAFVNGDVRLVGALFKSTGRGPFPAVVIVHGAGSAVYDEPAFRVHANAFVERGFAVLLYDKRGSGRSTGNLDTSDYSDLAGDVIAGVRFLRSRPDILPTKIGILGRSEGGWVGPLAAVRDSAIAFVIMSSGCAVSPYEENLFWTRRALRAHGASDSVIERAIAVKTALWSFYRNVAADSVSTRGRAGRAIHASLATQLLTFDRYRPEVPATIATPGKTSTGYFRAFANMIYYDPGPTLEALHAPLLELLGENDDIVEPATTIAALDRLRATGHDVTVRTFPGVRHSLLLTTPLGPRYPADYLDVLTLWARDRVKLPAGRH